TQINQMAQDLDNLTAPRQAVFAGLTVAPVTAAIDDGHGVVGLRGAASLCSRQYGGGAHMCSAYDLSLAIANAGLPGNAFNPAMDIPLAWVEVANGTHAEVVQMSGEPTAGLGDNCGSYTSADDAPGWLGSAAGWAVLDSSGERALEVRSIAGKSDCSGSHPI